MSHKTVCLLALLGVATCTLEPPRGPGDETDHPAAAAEWWYHTMALENGTIPPDAIERAAAHRQQMVDMEFDNGGIERGSWNWLGPGNVGGRIRSLWINPADPAVMVLGAVGGGIWRSTSGGSNWQPVDDFLPSLTIGCMASQRGSATTIYAGTGEMVNRGSHIPPGAGIYRSTNAGLTWTRLPSTANSNFALVAELAVSPSNDQRILAATDTGIWHSADGGGSWTRTLIGTMNDVAYHPTNGQVAVATRSGGRAYYSTDRGSSWTEATGLPASGGRIELRYAASSPATVYAFVEVTSNDSVRVYRSTDGGRSYSRRAANGLSDVRGWWNNLLWVDPTRPNTLVVGAVSLWRSSDGGASFVRITGNHADQHFALEHPDFDGVNNRVVFVCHDGGIDRTIDIDTASSGSGWQSLNSRLGITQFYGGSVSPLNIAFGGTQDNGTWRLENSARHEFSKVYGKDGMLTAADPTDWRFLYGEAQYAELFRTRDGGDTTEPIINNLPDTGQANAPWVAPLALDPADPSILWVCSKRLWRTTTAKAPLPTNVRWHLMHDQGFGAYSAIAIAPSDGNHVVVGTTSGEIWRSTDGRAGAPAWTRVNVAAQPNRDVLALAVDPRDRTQRMRGFGGFASDNLWFSNNGGQSWRSVSGTGASALPPAPVRSIAVHPRAEGWIYVGTDVGVFASTDNGQTWSTSNEGPALVNTTQLVLRDDGTLYAFTYGRGVYSAHAGMPRDSVAPTARASLTYLDGEANGGSSDGFPSGSGRQVAFTSAASNLTLFDNNGLDDVFVRDRQAGTTVMVSATFDDVPADGDSGRPAMAADGRFVAFDSMATNIVNQDSNGRRDIFVRDLQDRSTTRVSLTSGGNQANGHSDTPSLSGDGRYVVFRSAASNLFGGDSNGTEDVFWKDRDTQQVARVTVTTTGGQTDDTSLLTRRAVSDDGRFVVFTSRATNVVPGDGNGTWDVFLRDMSGNTAVQLVSRDRNGGIADGMSQQASISGDGRWVAFSSAATDLVAGDSNGHIDVFLWNRVSGATARISVSEAGAQADGDSYDPMISRDGNVVVFSSSATNLVPGDVNNRRDVFRYERGSGRLVRISVDSDGREANNHSYGGVPSDDGAFCALDSDANDLVDNDRNAARDVFVHEDTAREVVFPLQRRNAAGNTWTDTPFDSADLRLQQCARESRGRPALIRHLAFRRDDRGDQAAAVARRMEIELSMGPADIDAMTTRFASNWSGRATTVVTRKEVYLPDWTTAPVGLPRFEATIPLDMPYDHDGSSHLLWDMRVFDNSQTGRYTADADDGLIAVDSSSQALNVGCQTNAGYPFSHTLVYSSIGPRSSMAVTGARATRNAPVTLLLGTTDPNFSFLLCTGLRTDGALQIPIGLADSNGDAGITLLLPPWDPGLQGAVVYSQLVAPDDQPSRIPIVLSNGRRVTWPNTNPGPAMRRLVGPSAGADTGTLQDTGAVFKVGG